MMPNRSMITVEHVPLLVLTFLIAFIVHSMVKRRYKLPPGPRPWPLLGNLPLLAKNPTKMHLVMTDLAKIYGEIFTLSFGSQKAVFLNGIDIVKEAFAKKGDITSDRPNWLYLLQLLTKQKGVAFSNGHTWKTSRKLTLVALKDFGLGKRTLEDRVRNEGTYLLAAISDKCNEPFNPAMLLKKAVSNITFSMVFGYRFEYSDCKFDWVMEMLQYTFSSFPFADPINFFPWMRFFNKKKVDKGKKYLDDLTKFIVEETNRHRISFDPNHIRDIIDLCLQREQAKNDPGNDLGPDGMKMFILDLMFGASDTTSTTLTWALLYLVTHPDVQQKCHQEIYKVLGNDRPPSVKDQFSLPYTSATIRETQRLGNTIPISLPHAAAQHVQLGGYDIPERTIIFANFYALHTDPQAWSQPHTFRPERWLSEDGTLIKEDSFIPFGLGPRMCVGDSLAKTQLFIFFVMLLQRYTFHVPEGQAKPTKDSTLGFTLKPLPFEICAVEH